MTTFEKKELTGALFFNDKGDNDKRPDLRGYVIINGVEYELAGWNGKPGSKQAVKLNAKIKDERRDAPQPQQSISQRAMPKRPDPISSGRLPRQEMDDEIPF